MRRIILIALISLALFVSCAASAAADVPSAQAGDCNTDFQVCVLGDPALTPNDPLFRQQYGPQIVQAPGAWDVWTGAPSTVVAIVDTGIDCTHPDLIRCVPGYDFVNGHALTGIENSDDFGHGTHVTGIAAAALNNGLGIAGLAQVSYMPVKVCNSFGSCADSAVVQGDEFAADHGASVINMSLGGSLPGSMETGVDYAYTHGTLVISACGNSSSTQCLYPAAFANSMGVSCTDSHDALCGFSSHGTEVDVAGPGSGVLSTVPTGACSLCDPSGYRSLSGTSMSTPHATGVAGLIRSQHPEYGVDQTWGLLQLSADDLGDAGYDVLYGFGRVNALDAVTTPAPPGRLSPSQPPPTCDPPRHLNPHGKCVGHLNS